MTAYNSLIAAYYNENDPVAAEWLRRLIARGLIAPGEVDERDIRDVAPAELLRFTQCHFFAGIGLWSGALRRAGWPDDRPIWTGSCPCQPFSEAGAGAGFADERHLWPHWHWLIQHCRPRVIVGEQVAAKDGLGWFDLVSADLAGIGYARGAVDLAAAGFGMEWRGSAEQERLVRALRLCPDPMVARHLGAFADWADQALALGGHHIRQRLYFVGMADPDGEEIGGRGEYRPGEIAGQSEGPAFERLAGFRSTGGVVDGQRPGLERQRGDGDRGDEPGRLAAQADRSIAEAGQSGRVALGSGERREGQRLFDQPGPPHSEIARGGEDGRGDGQADALDGERDAVDWLYCRDGEWRPVRSGTFPLADANPGRLGQLRAYGNGLDFETATEFCRVVKELADA
ncbi:MAG: DNA cytosine methyltransferase [Pseudomonas sp.]|nr:DNA cytosine methyltransferase [Pseudomonas sp.]MBS67366.1 DNA cytosine methyltransferase [Pseudomonas sp.]|tara:strand:- start:904 stop:2103 length:1200 start_codon:yes stop_codon:yes gene_type:complete